MDDEKKVTKIVVNKKDELTDIVSAILDSRNERIVLTFAEETDLLISPINLKVLLETADESEKLLIAQIIKNPTGERNAALANLKAIDTPQFPEEEVWEQEEMDRAKRLNPPKKVSVKEKPLEETNVIAPSNFQKKIDETIARNKQKRESQEISEDDFLITLDEDLPVDDSSEPEIIRLDEDPNGRDLSKIDFKQKTSDPVKSPERRKASEKSSFSKKIFPFFGKIGAFFKNLPVPPQFKKLGPIIGGSILAIAILVGVIYINTGVVARVRIYVEAKEVEIEETFQGDENIKEVDFENFKIPVKNEKVEKARSTNITATGTAFRGEKAKGSVNITYLREDCTEDTNPLEIPAGHPLSTGGQTYTLDSAVSLKCNTPTEKGITAIEVGEEYNLAAGKIFTLQGYSTNQVLVLNNSGAITGGSKEEYTVLSKADVDAAVKELSEIAIEEGEIELRNTTGRWEIIEDSIVSKVLPDSTKTDVAIGTEARNVNVSIKTESIASYFLSDGFDEGIERLLTEKAEEENLFETDKEWGLELDEDIEKEVTVVESNAQGITIKLTAKSSVKPRVDIDKITEDLKGKKWEEGVSYVQSLDFSEKDARVEFFPEWFPGWLQRFPRRQGGILISIGEVN